MHTHQEDNLQTKSTQTKTGNEAQRNVVRKQLLWVEAVNVLHSDCYNIINRIFLNEDNWLLVFTSYKCKGIIKVSITVFWSVSKEVTKGKLARLILQSKLKLSFACITELILSTQLIFKSGFHLCLIFNKFMANYGEFFMLCILFIHYLI